MTETAIHLRVKSSLLKYNNLNDFKFMSGSAILHALQILPAIKTEGFFFLFLFFPQTFLIPILILLLLPYQF